MTLIILTSTKLVHWLNEVTQCVNSLHFGCTEFISRTIKHFHLHVLARWATAASILDPLHDDTIDGRRHTDVHVPPLWHFRQSSFVFGIDPNLLSAGSERWFKYEYERRSWTHSYSSKCISVCTRRTITEAAGKLPWWQMNECTAGRLFLSFILYQIHYEPRGIKTTNFYSFSVLSPGCRCSGMELVIFSRYVDASWETNKHVMTS